MLTVNVKDGTPRSDLPDLCTRCRWGQIMKTETNVEVRFCSRLERALSVPGPIVSCTKFSDTKELTLHEMSQIAWELKQVKPGQIGFVQKEREYLTFVDKAAKLGDSL